jgi:catechol-2,3-dioxygenase
MPQDAAPETFGINHLGLSVRDLEATTRFFTESLGWSESGRDGSWRWKSIPRRICMRWRNR